jgi:ariadne-1
VRDYSWLINAQSCLFRARRILAYSYAFAFYMFGNDLFKDDISVEQNAINQNLFEDHQQQLEATVERLAKLVETPFDQVQQEGTDVQAIRMEVVNLTAILETRCKTM